MATFGCIGIGVIGAAGGWAIGAGVGYVIGSVAELLAGNEAPLLVGIGVPIGGMAGAGLGVVVALRKAGTVTELLLRRIGIATLVMTSIGAALFLPPALRGLCVLPPAEGFDADAWRADRGEWPCTDRAGMTNDLLDGDVLDAGMHRRDVAELLGPPAADPALAGQEGEMVWSVRCWIDCEWLVVTLDAEDRLEGVTLRSD